MFIHTGTFFCRFMDSDTQKDFPSLREAQDAAAAYVGNNSYSKLPNQNTYLYGPGDGTTSVMVREHVRFEG